VQHISVARAMLALALAALAARVLTAPDYIQNLDGFLFVAGVDRYAVIELRPHFPGYPVYIWLGKLGKVLLGDAEQALRAVSILASALTVLPLGLLAAALRRASGGDQGAALASALAAGAVWTLAPGPWLLSGEIFSDPLGLLLALAMLLWLWRGCEADEPRALALAAAAGGVMLGARLDYFPFLFPLAFAVWQRRATPAARKAVLAFAAGVLLWLGWQLAVDRGSWFTALRRQVAAHVANPGNTVEGASDLILRPAGVLRATLDGLGVYWPGEPARRWPATLLLAALVVPGSRRLARTGGAGAAMVWLWAAVWAAWIVLFHDVTFPRYVTPLVAWAALVAGLGVPGGPARWPAAAALAASVASVGVPLAIAHRDHPPVGDKLARHVQARFRPRDFLILPHADGPVALRDLNRRTPDLRLRVVPPEQIGLEAARLAAEGWAVHATQPAPDAPERWRPVARFCRDPHLDPRGPFELWLFRLEAEAQPAGTPPPACQ
jgi:hypothetical protein